MRPKRDVECCLINILTRKHKLGIFQRRRASRNTVAWTFWPLPSALWPHNILTTAIFSAQNQYFRCNEVLHDWGCIFTISAKFWVKKKTISFDIKYHISFQQSDALEREHRTSESVMEYCTCHTFKKYLQISTWPDHVVFAIFWAILNFLKVELNNEYLIVIMTWWTTWRRGLGRSWRLLKRMVASCFQSSFKELPRPGKWELLGNVEKEKNWLQEKQKKRREEKWRKFENVKRRRMRRRV